MRLLIYPAVFDTLKRPMRISLLVTAAVLLILAVIDFQLQITYFLAVVEIILLIEIIYLNYKYYKKLLREGIDPSEVGTNNHSA